MKMFSFYIFRLLSLLRIVSISFLKFTTVDAGCQCEKRSGNSDWRTCGTRTHKGIRVTR